MSIVTLKRKIKDTAGLLNFAKSRSRDIGELGRRVEVFERCLKAFEKARKNNEPGVFKTQHTTVFGEEIGIDVKSEVAPKGQTNIDIELVAEGKGWIEYTLNEVLAKRVLAQREKESAFSDEIFDAMIRASLKAENNEPTKEDILDLPGNIIVSLEVLLEKELRESYAIMNEELED